MNSFFVQALLISILLSALGYAILCRNACSIYIFKTGIKAKYYFPDLSEKEIIFKENTVVEYDLGYYYYFSPEHSIAPMQLLYPCDTIYFYQVNKSEKILYATLTVYTSYYSFKVLRQHLAIFTKQP